MTEITLKCGATVLVDDEDVQLLHRWTWKLNHKGYVVAFIGNKMVRLHRLIVDAPADLQVDHINGDPLDNRRSNLRLATALQNHANQRGCANTTSRHRGVHWVAAKGRWRARIGQGKGTSARHLGYFDTEDAAAAAWDHAARELWGDYARLNTSTPG